MRRLFLGLALIMSALLLFAKNGEKQAFYVGTFTNGKSKGIYLCELDKESGKIVLKQTFAGIDNPSFLKVSPDKKFLYVVGRAPNKIESSGGYVQAYAIGKNNQIRFLNKQISHGADPCHIDVSPDGKLVAIANYSGGNLALYPVDMNGYLQKASSIINNRGSSVNKDRQTKPHAHSIKFSPKNNMVFSADLGTDQLDIFKLENNQLKKYDQKFVKMDPGAGPRHFTFYEKGDFIFVINELNSTISTVKQKDENWEIIQTVSTLPSSYEGVSYCADIHVSPDGNYLYGSNRGHNSIAVFRIDKESKELIPIGFVPTEGDWPRNFSLTPDGDLMLVANQNSGNITVFKIDRSTGIPAFTGEEIKLPSPVCIEFL